MNTQYSKSRQRRGHADLRSLRVLSLVFMVPSLALATACLDNKLDPDQVDHESHADGGAADAGMFDMSSDCESVAPVTGKKLFIAQNSDFKCYKSWMTYAHDVKGAHEGLSGEMAIYVNQSPDTETKTFPVGTIMFKTTLVDGFDKPVVHAMAKRGSGFNAGGALGWEYFELLMGKNEVPYILWRGAKPPLGEMYQALLGAANVDRPMTTDADCNSCHAKGTDGALGDDVLNLINGQ